MRDALGPNTILGYCTNVHAGPTYAQTLANLETHALAVKQRVSPDGPMGVGLWLAQLAAGELKQDAGHLKAFGAWLRGHGLLPFTFNGFPYGDFHESVVKHKVYHPNWTDERRLRYTCDLADIQARLLPDDVNEGGISTLPIGWRADIEREHAGPRRAAHHLRELADHLAKVERETGKLIHVDIEPEPGCYFDTSRDVVRFFKDHLLAGHGIDEDRVRRHIRVCHDICHAAVMFENQTSIFANYHNAGIAVGKVQVSSAVRIVFDALNEEQRRDALTELSAFKEDRYLHQTCTLAPPPPGRGQGEGELAGAPGSPKNAQTDLPSPQPSPVGRGGRGHLFFEDLPQALASAQPAGEWRVHFHVPLFLERFGLLGTTQDHVLECLRLARDSDVTHFEAETYAWGVLPDELKTDNLADGIARELEWLRTQARELISAEDNR